jgi:hypothetical protein
MKSRQEWIVIAALIAYLAFTPGFQMVRDILAHPIGRAAALVGIVYVWKRVSAIVAVLLVIGYMRCAKTSMWEGFETPTVTCTCETGFTYNPATNQCANEKGQVKDPVACTCPSGYAYDSIKKECVQASQMSEPTPPPMPMPATSTEAPAVSTGPVTSTAPMTTPTAPVPAAAPMPPPTAGPTPTEGFVGGYSKW